jgi:spoIIIJ-associated protein
MMNTEQVEEQKNKATKTLATMLDYLGLDAALKAENKGDRISVTVNSDDAGRIIGRKGQALESLQLLLNRMMFKGDPEFPRIFIDIDGYAKKGNRREGGPQRGGRDRDFKGRGGRSGGRRKMSQEDEETLRQQALDAAKEVKRWGEPVTLPPMNAHDRRIIHISLQGDDELRTDSEGEGSKKKVVISLK